MLKIPTVDEIRLYCTARHNTIDPELFLDFYTANGWVQGKGKPIKDWQACIRTWERMEPKFKSQPKSNGGIPPHTDHAALDKYAAEHNINTKGCNDYYALRQRCVEAAR